MDMEDGFVDHNHDHLLQHIIDRLPSVDVVLISDYNKGTVRRPLQSPLLACCREHQKTILVHPKGNRNAIDTEHV